MLVPVLVSSTKTSTLDDILHLDQDVACREREEELGVLGPPVRRTMGLSLAQNLRLYIIGKECNRLTSKSRNIVYNTSKFFVGIFPIIAEDILLVINSIRPSLAHSEAQLFRSQTLLT